MLGGRRQQARRAIDGDAGARRAGGAEAELLQLPQAGVLPGLLARRRHAHGSEARERALAQAAEPWQVLSGQGVSQFAVVVFEGDFDGHRLPNAADLNSVVSGTMVSVLVALGGLRILKQKKLRINESIA